MFFFGNTCVIMRSPVLQWELGYPVVALACLVCSIQGTIRTTGPPSQFLLELEL